MSGLVEHAQLTIIADDLTGALDTAGHFASIAAPSPSIGALQRVTPPPRLAASTETRDLESDRPR